MKYCCSHNDFPFLSWAASLSHSGKETGGASPLPRALGDIPGKAAAPEEAREEEEGQKQEVMRAERASKGHQGRTQAEAVGRQPGAQPPTAAPSHRTGSAAWCYREEPAPAVLARAPRTLLRPAPPAQGRNGRGHRLQPGPAPQGRSEPLPTAGVGERLSPPMGGHIWILRFGKS